MEGRYQQQAIEEVFDPLDHCLSEWHQNLASLPEDRLNTVPFTGSWTAGQITRHIIKSNRSIAQALNLPGKTTPRSPDQRMQELKELFLDFTIKFEAAPFIMPTQKSYRKEGLITDLRSTTERVKETSHCIELGEAIQHPAFGEITKLELLYFVLYHTQRHLRQLKKIIASI